jgi:hypothetical protein
VHETQPIRNAAANVLGAFDVAMHDNRIRIR